MIEFFVLILFIIGILIFHRYYSFNKLYRLVEQIANQQKQIDQRLQRLQDNLAQSGSLVERAGSHEQQSLTATVATPSPSANDAEPQIPTDVNVELAGNPLASDAGIEERPVIPASNMSSIDNILVANTDLVQPPAITETIVAKDVDDQQSEHQQQSSEAPNALLVDQMRAILAQRNSSHQTTISSPANEVDIHSGGLFSAIFKWFFHGNPLAKVGMLLLFFGISYLLKYSVENQLLPIELRLIGATVICLVLLGLGWFLRLRNQMYALILQGGAIGGFYITTFASFKLYELLPHLLAFGFMILICIASVGLAVLQRALSLAVVASIGGYLAPILLSTGSNNYIGLFSYYLMLSSGILAISVWQSWRILNLIGFLFTYTVGITWWLSYSVAGQDFLIWQLLLLANLILFGVLTTLSSLRNAQKNNALIDGSLFFGAPIISFGLQYDITQQWSLGPAFSALVYGLLYLVFAWYLLKYWREKAGQLISGGLALGTGFVTLAIPLALSAQWTALGWLLLGVSILWTALQQGQRRFSWAASLVILMGGFTAHSHYLSSTTISFSMLVLFAVLAVVLLVAGGLWQHYRLQRSFWQWISRLFLVIGLLSWLRLINSIMEKLYTENILHSQFGLLMLSFLLLLGSTFIWRLAAKKFAWRDLDYSVWLLWLALVLGSVLMFMIPEVTLSSLLLWLPVLVATYVAGYSILRNHYQVIWSKKIGIGLHITLFISVLLSAIRVLQWFILLLAPSSDVTWISVVIICSLAILVLIYGDNLAKWPVIEYQRVYTLYLLTLLTASLFLLMIIGNVYSGFDYSQFYLPVLNQIEIPALIGFVSLVIWRRWLEQQSLFNQRLVERIQIAFYLLAGLWINSFLIRILAYYGDIPWLFDDLWDSRLVQACLAICWTLIALVCMLRAGRQGTRRLWFYGAGILVIVICKLILIDSLNGGGLMRAIAFIGVALLFLTVGYFAPLPPKQSEQNAQKELSL